MPKPKRRTTSSALLGDAPARSSLIIDGGAAAAASPPEPQLAAAATPFAAASAIAGHPPGMDPQEANAAIEELSELQARDPEAFAELMQAALSGEGADDKVGELWEKAKQGKAPAPAGAPERVSRPARAGDELELPGGRVLGAGGATRPATEDGIRIVPTPGFVLKTTGTQKAPEGGGIREAGAGAPQKYFVNVCSAAAVGAPKPTKRLDNEGNEVEGVSVPVSIGPPRGCADNKGTASIVVDCVVNPTVLAECVNDETGAQRDFICQLALTYVEQKYKLTLDRKYKLPRMKYKGDPEEGAQYVRDSSKEASKVAEASPGDVHRARKAAAPKMALGPAPDAELWYAPMRGAALVRAPDGVSDDAWPVVLLPRGPREGFDAIPADADRPRDLVVRLSLPRDRGSKRDPFASGKVAASAFAVRAVMPGREKLVVRLPFGVESTTAVARHRKPSASRWVLDVELPVDQTDFAAAADPGSKQARVARALRGGKKDAAGKADDAAAAPAPAAPEDRYGLREAATASAAPALEKPPSGASVHDLAFAAAHAADVAARAADNAGERDDGVFPEDRFHRADILSQHYINQREQSVEDKKKAAEKERARDKSEDGIEYVDLEDYKPGGKFSDQPAPPPELEDVKEPAPAVATFEAAPASGGVELESSLWTELL